MKNRLFFPILIFFFNSCQLGFDGFKKKTRRRGRDRYDRCGGAGGDHWTVVWVIWGDPISGKAEEAQTRGPCLSLHVAE